MTVFAACLFTLAAFASGWAMLVTVRRFGAATMDLRAQLRACPRTMTLEWSMVERVTVPALAPLRTRRAPRMPERTGLDWPQLERAA